MKAKIRNIVKNNNDFQHPQIDVEVVYTHSDLPNGERLYVFTLPHEEYCKLDETTLREMITKQGECFKEMLKKVEDMETKEADLSSLIDLEVTI